MRGGEPLVLRSPVFEAAADTVQQQNRRISGVAVDPDPDATSVHIDEGGPAHALAAPEPTAARAAVLNRSAASSTGPLIRRSRSDL